MLTDYKYVGFSGTRRGVSNNLLEPVIDLLTLSMRVVVGDAPGVDKQVLRYAKSKGIIPVVCYAPWDSLGNKAGPIRNQVISELCDVLIAFPDEKSKGTWNAVNCVKKLEKPVYVIKSTRDVEKILEIL